MSNAPTPEGRGTGRPNAAEPLFPSEGPFNPVVPLSEIGETPAPLALPAGDPADVGKPAEAAWARDAHRAGRREEEETLVPSRAARAQRGRPSWLVPAFVIVISVVAGLASGTYLIWSSQRAREATPPARVAAEAQAPPPAPPAESSTKVEEVREPVRDEEPGEVAKAEKPVAPSPAPTPAPSPQPAARAERAARAAAEPKGVAPAPKPAPSQSASSTRTRPTNRAQQPPKATSSAPPISSPPPTAKSKKVIQWP